jgi:Flp pilus assembly protein TadD
VLVGLSLVLLSGCAGGNFNGGFKLANPEIDQTSLYQQRETKKLDLAKKHFRQGDFGLAVRFYQKAVEEDSKNSEAWLGLAASYDRLRRFDEADQAYKILIKQTGRTPVVLNNLGYHYLLRGERTKARETLLVAQSNAGGNPYIKNNLAMLDRVETHQDDVLSQ